MSGAETDEDVKRKREDNDSSERTKLLRKTTMKRKEGTEEKMIEMMKELMSKNENMMTELKQIRQEQKETNEQLSAIRKENITLKKEIEQLSNKVETLERRNKKENLIISGIQIPTNDDKEIKRQMERFIAQELKMDVKIRNASRITDKVCVIQMENMCDKLEILKHKKLLKAYKDKVYIESELTKKELEIQKEIKQISMEERRRGNSTKIGYKKLIINGSEWKWNETAKALQKTNNTTTSKN
ncbi:spindle assembly checkpoint component MAD1-like [Photinus pyralis]|nr:spindle assembly checkpoint component MAD1-like [Photinus pyralis]